MDDNASNTPWDELGEQLGAEPAGENTERRQRPSTEIPSVVSSTPPPPAAPSDWNALADSLGLEVDDQTDLPGQPVGESAEAAVPSDSPPPAEDRAAPTVEEADQEDFALPPLPDEVDQVMSESSWGGEEAAPADPVDETAENVGTETDADEDSPADDTASATGISGEAAQDAFDALFTAGGSAWAVPPSQPQSLSPLDSSEPLELDALQETAGDAGKGEADGDAETERPKRRRSRRRRGRGGRHRDGEPAPDSQASSETSGETSSETSGETDAGAAGDLDELSELADSPADEKPRRRRSRRRRRRSSASADPTPEAKDQSAFDESAEDAPLEEEQEDATKRRRTAGRARTGHRNLPTWGEAIGVIVDANLEQRRKAPSKPSSSRGRGRGGRRRKKT